MKKYGLAIIAALLLVGGYGQKVEALLCSSGSTYTDLVAFGGAGCTIDDKIFRNFNLSGDLGSADITYIVVDTGVLEGLQFQFNMTVPDGTTLTLDTLLLYDVACLDGSNCITSSHLVMTGAGINGGSALVSETDVLNGGGSVGLFTISSDAQTPK